MLLISLLAVLTLMVIGFVSAGPLVSNVQVEFNGEDIGPNNDLASFAGDVVPVKVTFEALVDSEDVTVKVSIYDGREDFDATTKRFNVVAGSTYTKLLSLRIPSDIDTEYDEFTLSVEVDDKDFSTDNYDQDYRVQVQRESYTLDILSVDYNTKVSSGNVFPVSVVLENNGFNSAEDNYVLVSIPALGVSTRSYIGDLDAVEDYGKDNHEEDAIEEVVYLKVPENAQAGVYEMEVTVYNDDSSNTVKRLISVDESSSMVLATVKNKDLNAGETVTYELLIVNSADDVKVYNIKTVSGEALSVSAPSVVTVGPDSSEVVPITVTANAGADVGTYTFSVDVEGKQVVFGANVVGSSVSASTVALTVILVIIFVVLLAVLVVLLTRKERQVEEVETSYY